MCIYDLADRGNLSLYESLYRHIRDDILAGNLLPDDRLPSKRSLAADLGVSVITVEGAYRQLQAEGYIVSRERSGYYVRSIATRPHATRPVSSHAVTSRPTFAVADFSSAPACSDRSFARLWEKTLRDVIAHESEQDLFARQPPQGSQRLRECIASWLARARGIARIRDDQGHLRNDGLARCADAARCRGHRLLHAREERGIPGPRHAFSPVPHGARDHGIAALRALKMGIAGRRSVHRRRRLRLGVQTFGQTDPVAQQHRCRGQGHLSKHILEEPEPVAAHCVRRVPQRAG